MEKDDPNKIKEALQIIFGALNEYYQNQDQEEVRSVLIDIVKSGKARKRAIEKYFPNGIFPDSMRSVSMRTHLTFES